MSSGVYKIKNLSTEKVYIGASEKVSRRWSAHRRMLNKGNHHSTYLQNSWNKYGSEYFVFGIIEKCEEDEIWDREKYWIDEYDAFEEGYNQAKDPKRPMLGKNHTEKAKEKMSKFWNKYYEDHDSPMKGETHSEEAKEIIGKKSRDRYSDPTNHPMYGTTRSEECKEKIREKKKEYYKTHDSPMKGETHTQEAKEKMSEAVSRYYENHDSPMKNETHDEETRKQLSESLKEYYEDNDPWNKGQSLKEETKKKLSESCKGKEIPEHVKEILSEVHSGEGNSSAKLQEEDVRKIHQLYDNGDGEFSQKELGNKFGVSQAQIYHIVNGESWKHIFDEFQ